MNKKDFSNFIKEKRSELDLTQEQLAEKLCVSRKVVSSWESGMRYPDIETVQLLAEVLQVTPTELFEKCSVNDKKYAINPAFIIAPIIMMIAIVGVVVTLTLRDNTITPAGNVESASNNGKTLSEYFDGDINEVGISYNVSYLNSEEVEVVDYELKTTMLVSVRELDEDEIAYDYDPSNCTYEIKYMLRRPERATITIKINVKDKTAIVTTYDGSVTAYKYDEKTMKPIIDGIIANEAKKK